MEIWLNRFRNRFGVCLKIVLCLSGRPAGVLALDVAPSNAKIISHLKICVCVLR